MERFFGSVKEECVGNTISTSYEQARLLLFTYLQLYYHLIRRHSTLGYVSPCVYEQRALLSYGCLRRLRCHWNRFLGAPLGYVCRGGGGCTASTAWRPVGAGCSWACACSIGDV
jgi:integrase-like protein